MTTQIHEMTCDNPWFSYIRQGVKPVEGRKNSPKHQKIKKDDTIVFINGHESFQATVVEIRHYKSLEEYLKDVTIEKALPGIHGMEEAVRIYHQWSTPEEITRYGFLGIFVTVKHPKSAQ